MAQKKKDSANNPDLTKQTPGDPAAPTDQGKETPVLQLDEAAITAIAAKAIANYKEKQAEEAKQADMDKATADKLAAAEAEKNAPEPIDLTFKVIGDTEEERKGRKSEYTVKVNEQKSVHVELEATEFEKRGGKKKTSPRVVKIDTHQWPSFRDTIHTCGFSYRRVLWAPEGVDREFPEIKTPSQLIQERKVELLKQQIAAAGFDIVPKQ